LSHLVTTTAFQVASDDADARLYM